MVATLGYNIAHTRNKASAFRLYITLEIEKIIVDMTNLEEDSWQRMDGTDMHTC